MSLLNAFGVRNFNIDYQHYLIVALQLEYKISTNETGPKICGLKFNWNIQQIDGMPDFVHKMLTKLKFEPW